MKESWQERRKKQRHTCNYKRPFLPFLKKIGLYPTGNRRLFKDLKQKSDMTYKQFKKKSITWKMLGQDWWQTD